ncbi:MAG TPA: LytTR family DNA-binding domain-containing protein [Caulobacteraceae bacterium]|nr:LytTR family DNA-binding domain-containing protein [Caulobacteraceae bacterium]
MRAAAWRVVAVALGVALVVGLSAAHSLADLVQQAVLSVVGAAIGLAVARWIVPYRWYETRLWAVALLIAACITPPMVAMVLAELVLFRHARLTIDGVREMLPSEFATTLVITALALLTRRPATQTHAAAQGAPPAKFLARLTPKLRGGTLYAVEAEDHYLRLHTSLGQDLILMRLGDAIAELEGLEGARTHRSWWVAKEAVAKVERFEGRATLTLKDGSEVPVSRGYARELRAAGWF